MSHGNERWFQDAEVAVKSDGTMLGFRTKALDDAGAFLRYEPLGGVIWSQVTPGCYRWRNIRVEFTQVMTNKAPVLAEPRLLADAAPLVHRAGDRHRRERARARPGRGAEAQLRPRRGHAVRDAQRLRLRLGRLRADARHRARADRLRRARGAAARRGVARQAARLRDRLDARLRHEQLRPVAADQPGAPVLGQQRGGLGQARHLRRGRGHARNGAAGPGARDDGRAGRRRHHRLSRPTTSTSAPATTATGTRTPGFSGTYASQFAVTGLGAVKGAAEHARRRDQEARRGRARLRRRRHRARRGASRA